MVEVESEIREMVDESTLTDAVDDDPDGHIDLRVQFRKGVAHARVESVDKINTRTDPQLEIIARVDGERRSYRIDWPEDPLDPEEPLTRLCRFTETSVERVGDLDGVPLIRDADGDWMLFIPPRCSENSYEVILPTDRRFNFTIPHPLDFYFNRVIAPILLLVCRTPFFRAGQDRNGDPRMTSDTSIFFMGVIFPVLLPIAAYFLFGSLLGEWVILVLGMFTIVLCCIGLFVTVPLSVGALGDVVSPQGDD